MPQPVGPMMPKNSRSRTSRLTPPIARVVPWAVTNSLVTPLTTTFISIPTGWIHHKGHKEHEVRKFFSETFVSIRAFVVRYPGAIHRDFVLCALCG